MKIPLRQHYLDQVWSTFQLKSSQPRLLSSQSHYITSSSEENQFFHVIGVSPYSSKN